MKLFIVTVFCVSLTGCAMRVAPVGVSVAPDGAVTRHNPEMQQPEDDPSVSTVVAPVAGILAGMGGPLGVVGGLVGTLCAVVAKRKHTEAGKAGSTLARVVKGVDRFKELLPGAADSLHDELRKAMNAEDKEFVRQARV